MCVCVIWLYLDWNGCKKYEYTGYACTIIIYLIFIISNPMIRDSSIRENKLLYLNINSKLKILNYYYYYEYSNTSNSHD